MKKKISQGIIAEMKEEEKEVRKQRENRPETLKSDYFEQWGITLSSITQDVKMRQNIPENVSGLLVIKANKIQMLKLKD